MMINTPFLDVSKYFLHDLLNWLWTFTFESWGLHGGQWLLHVSPLDFLFSFHQMADSLLDFLSVHLQRAGLTARNCQKTDLGLPELAQKNNVLTEFTPKVYFFCHSLRSKSKLASQHRIFLLALKLLTWSQLWPIWCDRYLLHKKLLASWILWSWANFTENTSQRKLFSSSEFYLSAMNCSPLGTHCFQCWKFLHLSSDFMLLKVATPLTSLCFWDLPSEIPGGFLHLHHCCPVTREFPAAVLSCFESVCASQYELGLWLREIVQDLQRKEEPGQGMLPKSAVFASK